MRRKKLLVADLLCGAGGSSTGCERALKKLGLDMELVCVNHWPTAIETHQKNHPHARHFVQDIATVRPHMLVPEGYLDLLMASPTCTHHSNARGGKPTSDQQRSDPWHIITWLTELRVKRIIIENVWEYRNWGPVNARTGKPIKSRQGEYFRAWMATLQALGFNHLEYRKLVAADYGGATTRARFMLMGRSDRVRVLWPVQTHADRKVLNPGLFDGPQPWTPARKIIDWSIKGVSIFGRPKPLAPKTLLRIFAGAVRFEWPEPYLVRILAELENSLHFHVKDAFSKRHVKRKTSTPASRRTKVRKVIAMLRDYRKDPLSFSSGGRRAEPIIITFRQNADGRSIDKPIPAVTAKGTHIGIAQPVVVNLKGQSTATSVEAPLPTQTAGAGHLYQAEPIVLSQCGGGAARSTEKPLPTILTGGAGVEGRAGCARPMLVTVAHGNDPKERDPNSRRVHSLDDPLGAVHGTGPSHALIAPYYGSGSGETCSGVDEPMPTVTSKGRFGMVVPVTNSNGGAQARNINTDPLPTLTTARGGEFAAVLPVSGANDLHEFDVLFRMLEPPELASAMGFNTEEQSYEFAGTKTEMIKQIGNAVSVEKMEACVSAICADAAPMALNQDYLEAAE